MQTNYVEAMNFDFQLHFITRLLVTVHGALAGADAGATGCGVVVAQRSRGCPAVCKRNDRRLREASRGWSSVSLIRMTGGVG